MSNHERHALHSEPQAGRTESDPTAAVPTNGARTDWGPLQLARVRTSPREPGNTLGSSGQLAFAGVGLCALGLVLGPRAAPQTQPGVGTQVFQPAAFGNSSRNGSMIAVTGPDVTGGGVLYLIDTETKQLACYQATGGSSTAGVRLIGARRVDLDLQVLSYNDDSKLSYEDLQERFDSLGGGE